MKKLLLLSCLIFSVSATLKAQEIVETVKLSNGKTVVLYDNQTWEYKKTLESISNIRNENTNSKNKRNLSSTPSKRIESSSSSYKSVTGYCGAPTKKGGSCRRKVSGGGRCWQHGG